MPLWMLKEEIKMMNKKQSRALGLALAAAAILGVRAGAEPLPGVKETLEKARQASAEMPAVKAKAVVGQAGESREISGKAMAAGSGDVNSGKKYKPRIDNKDERWVHGSPKGGNPCFWTDGSPKAGNPHCWIDGSPRSDNPYFYLDGSVRPGNSCYWTDGSRKAGRSQTDCP